MLLRDWMTHNILSPRPFCVAPHTAHLGSQVAALAETRLLTRASTWLAKSIVMARARLACLPLDHSARLAGITICQTGIPDTWMSSSLKILKKVLQVEYDLWDDLGAIPPEVFIPGKIEETIPQQILSPICFAKNQIAGALLVWRAACKAQFRWFGAIRWLGPLEALLDS